MANGCVAAIRKGCELYKDVKGTISAAQKTAKEVTAIAEEVGGFFGFFKKKKKPTDKPVDAPKPGSYAETRMRELKEQRDMYNVNYLGYYKGGLPQKDRGNLRGEAMAPPDWFH